MISADFINECKKGAYCNRFGKLVVNGIDDPYTQSNNISKFEIDSGCYIDGNIVGTLYIRALNGQLLDMESVDELIDKDLNAQVGVKLIDSDVDIDFSSYSDSGWGYSAQGYSDGRIVINTRSSGIMYQENEIITITIPKGKKFYYNVSYSSSTSSTFKAKYKVVSSSNPTNPSSPSGPSGSGATGSGAGSGASAYSDIPKTEGTALSFSNDTEIKIAFDGGVLSPLTATVKFYLKGNGEHDEYIDLGKFKVERPVDENTLKECKFTAYSTIYSHINKPYICGLNFDLNNVITVADLYQDVCNQLQLVPKTLNFTNNSIRLNSNPFQNNETNRVVLECIAKVSCSFITIDEETDEIDLSWLSTSSTPDYTFQLSDYSTLEGGIIKLGPINSVILKQSQIDDENVSMKDDESISEYGENQLVISEDYILYNSELREEAITSIFEKLNGLEYYDSKIVCYYGKPFLKIGNKIRIYRSDNSYFDTYVLKHKFTYDGSFKSEIESPVLTKLEVANKQDISLGQALKNTEIEVNKQGGYIRSLTTQTNQIASHLENDYYTINQTEELVQNAKDGLTNTFTTTGGDNIFRNTGLWFLQKDDNNPFEYWNGVAVKGRNDLASCKNSIILQNGTFSQSQEVSNGFYTVSFKYKKSVRLATAQVVINDVSYNLDSLNTVEFVTGQMNSEGEYITLPVEVNSNHIVVNFICDTNNAVEVFDLMVNKGQTKSIWTQNQNETTTDTVNISKGITISSSDMEVSFKANADGIRTIDRNEQVLTKFTDKGMVTKEAVIEVEADVCGTMIALVGDQTWFTKL